MLIAMVVQIDDISRPVAGQSGATGTELDLARRLGELQGDALAAALHIPRIGELEVVQVIAEYLGGLVENSPLKDVLADWAGRFTGAHAPPPAEETVVPDPARLKAAPRRR